MLKNGPLIVRIGVETAENELRKESRKCMLSRIPFVILIEEPRVEPQLPAALGVRLLVFCLVRFPARRSYFRLSASHFSAFPIVQSHDD